MKGGGGKKGKNKQGDKIEFKEEQEVIISGRQSLVTDVSKSGEVIV